MQTGIVTVSYRIGDTAYTREVFSNAPDQALIVRISADKPNALRFGANLFRKFDSITEAVSNDTVSLDGQCGAWGTKFHARLKAVPEGGGSRTLGDHIYVEGANAVTLVLTVSTDFRHERYREQCREELERATGIPFAQ